MSYELMVIKKFHEKMIFVKKKITLIQFVAYLSSNVKLDFKLITFTLVK